MGQSELPEKLFFKIGEVAQIVGVKPHVLRYWETEFSALRPMKTRGSHRMYRRRDVELAMLLKRLLHEERLTVAGAKKRLRQHGQHKVEAPPDPDAAKHVADRTTLLALRKQLSELLGELDRVTAAGEVSEDATATVTAAGPGSATVYKPPSSGGAGPGRFGGRSGR